MKPTHLFIVLFTVCVLQVHAQRELLNPLLDSKEVITKGVALHDAGKYKDAIELFLKVPESDTAYASVLHELILSYYNDSNFVEAENYSNKALEIFPHRSGEWYGFLADIYDDTKRSDLALKAYDTILAQNPYNYLTYFNRGITQFRRLAYDSAMLDFQQCIILNPYYTSAHYFLGQLALLKGNLVPAMLSFATNLMIAPGNRYQKSTISFLATISEVNTTATGYLQNYKKGKQDDFDEIQDILVSKAALEKNYKLKAELEDPVVRQLQVVMEKLENNANDKGFWMQYYVPLFKSLWEKGHFEPMVFHMFSELDVKKIKDYIKKEKKKVENFTEAASGYLSQLRERHEVEYSKRMTTPVRFFFKNYLVSGKGAYGLNARNEEEVIGPWKFYYENGRVKSNGNFDKEGRRTGEWRYYFEDGTLKEVSNYSDDLANGKSQVWHDNGLTSTLSSYAADKTDGVETNYFYSGMLSSVIPFKSGRKEGLAKYYNSAGYLRTATNYTDNLQEGAETVYHPSGTIESVVNYVKDLANGEYKEYHNNGKQAKSGTYAAGKKTGTWNHFYADGGPEQVENFVNGDLDGERVYYYPNGRVSSRQSYRKDEIDGKKEDFDEDGIVFCETIFEKGRLKDIKFFDKAGGVISNTSSRKGNADIAFYAADGAKISQGYYSKDGLAEGKFTEFFKNGEVYTEGLFKNGSQDGKKVVYYGNGKISQQGSYNEGKAHGYFVNFFNNGQVSSEGWYVDGDRQGTFLSYDLLGNMTSRVYYLNDKVHGVSTYYTPVGKVDYKQYYDSGWFLKIEQYDSSGKKILLRSALNKGEGTVRFNHFNGKPYFESSYKYYEMDGAYKVTNGDGSRASLYFHKHGALDSTYTSWHPNSKLQSEGKYAGGYKTGTWKYYHFNGQLFETETYTDGRLEGADIQYDEFGAMAKEYQYKKGELEGPMKMFGDNGQLILVFYYKHDNVIGYSYEGSTGKLVPMIPLVKGAGLVESYYKNGVKSAHMIFRQGMSEGDRILYYSNGKEQSTVSRVNGLENGIKKIYYPGGKIMQEENYYYGERHGPAKFYSENGALIYERNYFLGSLNGDSKYFTGGKLTQTYTYHFGVLEVKK